MMNTLSTIFFLSLIWKSQEITPPNIITINQGKIQGVRNSLPLLNLTFDSYLGVPYAQPPIGNLTFKAPLPAKSWEGIFNASKESPNCPQNVDNNGKCYEGQLDCLYLNIYIPVLEGFNGTFPVMVWIYGGGFNTGTNDQNFYGPEYLLQKGVIVVSINYRLSVYGFLSLNSIAYPGNAGLKDQRLALEWVYSNIGFFGGDNNQITIFGESAGGMSVHYHILSPSSNRFQKAIAQSGNALFLFENPKNPTLLLAKEVGCLQTTDEEIIECLQALPVNVLLFGIEKIIQEQTNDPESANIPIGYFIPTSEPEGTPDFFFKGNPYQLMLSGNFSKVPFITGLNSAEAVNSFIAFWPKIDLINENFTNIFIPEVQKGIQYLGLDLEEISRNTKQFYFNNKNISLLNVNSFIACIGDIYFLQSGWQTIELMSLADSTNNHYFYEFSFYGALSYPKFPLLSGVAHANELPYIFFQRNLLTYLLPSKSFEKQIIKEMTTMWTDFAKNGNPTSAWKPTINGSIDYYNIDKGLFVSSRMENENNSLGKRIKFWRDQFHLP